MEGSTSPLPRLSLRAAPAERSGGLALRYPPTKQSVGIVHLGLGNFHRAHQAVHVDAALAAGESDWAISAWNLHSRALPQALAAQDGLYTLLVRSSLGTDARLLAPIREAGCAAQTPTQLLERLASPATRIVSLSITEKGYCLDAEGALDANEPALAADLAGAWPPRTALGWLAAGLAARLAREPTARITLLSCDNLSANGHALERALDAFLRARTQHALADRLPGIASFPNAMVDRIVPATTDADRALAAELTGFTDACPVATEPFSQWVIEDRFAAGRPRFESSGVTFSDDVAGWEQMKLRLLNAAHSVISYLGVLAGWRTVDAAVSQPPVTALLERLWASEAIPALPARLHSRAPAYCAELIVRFSNTALAHQTAQIAMDGSKKIPLRWLPTVLTLDQRGQPWPVLALALAAWIRCLEAACSPDASAPPPRAVSDPLATALAPLARLSDPAQAVRAVLRAAPGLLTLAERPNACAAITQALATLRAHGPRESIQRLTGA